MPWYYAGPEAKPVGPVSAEQLQGLFASGAITSETFVIEHTGPGAANLAWRRYREVFTPAALLPPLPPTPPAPFHPVTGTPPAPPAPAPGAVPAPIPSSPTYAAAHPLFPSATTAQPGHAAYPPPVQPYAYAPIRPTNSWCAWGFALSLVGFCFAFLCIGVIPALIAAVLCIIGLVQVNKNREEGGMGLAVTGLIFSGVAILIVAIIVSVFAPSILKGHGLTVTEQTSNDSE
ncbi:MAG TPA: GYF domain-containing protein [Candidatus Methylacidiphilales bacterium]|jgi:hypothetical protein|nr:GYF domain-containing protein [Candidatus Methylacidiphilales bacterium]